MIIIIIMCNNIINNNNININVLILLLMKY